MKIQTTGIEQYMPGGAANMKVMVIGGPGAGKTRWSSFWPAPFYLNCEAGLASIADRHVPFVDIVSDRDGSASDKMLNAVKWLKNHPDAEDIGTVVVDTVDAFARKVKDEWLQANNASAFSGYDAWGYLDAKMQAMMTRLLSLDKHVIILVHYKDKTTHETDPAGNKTETTVTSLQLQGDIKDTIFNDFDLVGWMDTYWKDGGENVGKVEARGITFQRTPQRPFLKDRLFITPKWLQVDFAETDYTNLFARFVERLDELSDGEVVGEVSFMPDDPPEPGDAVAPSRGGALPPQDPRDMPLDQLKKPELLKMGKELGMDLKSSMLKGELIDAISQARQAAAETAQPDAPAVADDAVEASDVSSEQVDDSSTPSTPVEPEAIVEAEPEIVEPEPESEPEPEPEPEPEVVDPEALIASELGGEVVAEDPAQPEPEPQKADPTTSADPLADATCEVCDKPLSGENRDWVRLAFIKYRQYLCNDDYQEKKKA